MIISHHLKYAFISTPKCCTNTMYEVLQSHCKGQRHGGFHAWDISMIKDDWFVFTVVRNPYQRAVSSWFSSTMRGLALTKDRYGFRAKIKEQGLDPNNFEHFMTWVLTVPKKLKHNLIESFEDRHGDYDFDFVLKTESIEEDIRDLPFDFTGKELPRVNATYDIRKEDEFYLTPKAIELINEWACKDFERYGYEKISNK